MKTLNEFLTHINARGVKLWIHGEALRYSAPENALTPELLKELGGRKQEVIAFLKENPLRGAIPALDRDGNTLPLSFAQQRLWFLDQLDGGSATYNIPGALRLDGSLNRDALEQSLQELIQRHESLRASFPMADGTPEVRISDMPFELGVTDLTALSAKDQEREVKQRATDDAQRVFDLAEGPLFHASLLLLEKESHVLLLNMHHIISDGWSMDILVGELSALYAAFAKGQPSPLPPLSIQYVDFANWQRQWLEGEILDKQLNYWTEKLSGAPALLELPTDRPRPPVQSFRGDDLSISLSKELTDQLKSLSQQTNSTLFMTLLAAFTALLSRYSGQSDIVIGSPIAGRTHSQTESLIGFFVNTLAFRTVLAENPTFENLLEQARKTALEAYAHQDIPFGRLVEALQPERNLRHSPLFQVMFALQGETQSDLELDGLNLTLLNLENTVAKFDLTLTVAQSAKGQVCTFEYNTDIFDRSTIERMSGNFVTLLTGLVANPEKSIYELSLLTQAEEQQLMDWNNPTLDYPQDKPMAVLFEEQAEKTPDAVAVVFGEEQLTYRELNVKANQLARHLQKLGVGPEVLVGICLERSLDMIIALFGILKAGGAYVPLDPAYPESRIAFMLEDAEVSVLLTQASLVKTLPETTARIVCLDRDAKTFTSLGRENFKNEVGPENLAYVIYTSGSTGRPKGVMMEQRNAMSFLAWARTVYSQEQLSGVLGSTSLNFDMSVFEIFATLSIGGRVILVINALELPALPDDAGVTLVNTVPSAMAELVRSNGVPDSVQVVNLGGEALQNSLVQQIYGIDTIKSIYNLYGPSEDTTYSALALMNKGSDEAPLIGRPIVNTQFYILDAYLQPVPIGVPGELHIGGEGLSRGYLGRPELTKEKFISNPFSKDPTSRLYKTGDLARYMPDGDLDYMGRIDNQVKIRGFRVELGEIETALDRCAGMRESAVVLHTVSDSDKRLVAYLVAEEAGQTIDTAELRNVLKESLPDYMVPAFFITLDALPLNPNGKVDRLALGALSLSGYSMPEENFTAPRNPEEELLAGMWAEVLGLERISVHSNFFELGGHSLLVTQIIARIRDTFEIEISARGLFEAPTVEGLSKVLATTRRDASSGSMTAITHYDREQSLPLSFAQHRLWFLEQLEEGQSTTYNMPAALRLEGPLNQAALEQALEELVQRHESLRTSFPIVNGEPEVKISAVDFTLDVTDFSELSPEEREVKVRSIAEADVQRPFDLANGPLFRTSLLRLDNESHVLLFTMHHIITDGWSMDVLIGEWGALYEAFSKGLPSPLPALAVQYVDFANWQREWLSGEVLDTQLSYWKEQLSGAPALLELPTDRPRPPVQTYEGASLSFSLSPEVTEQLKALSRKGNATLFMTLLASYTVLLSRYSGQSDVVVGSPIAGRTHSQLEPLIGFFVNTLALRLDLTGNPVFEDVLEQARRTALEAYAHQDIPFERLVAELQLERNLSHSALFQAMFVLRNDSRSDLKLEGMNLSQLELERTIAKFDLTLTMEETEAGLDAEFEYNTDLFDQATIERMIGHFKTLLESLATASDKPIHDLPLLTQSEERQLLDWNDTAVDYALEKTLVDHFEEQAAKTPDAVAVVFEEEQLTYQELNHKANQLARHLQGLGVGPEVLVGVCLERSLEMVIGLYGILKAGGAYVPMDPNYPAARLAYMLEDSNVPVLLTQTSVEAILPETAAKMVSMDGEAEAFLKLDGENLKPVANSENLAYMIYTSGSTGRPKGAMNSHRGICNRLLWMQDAYQLTADDTVLQKTPFSFDVSVWEFFWPLLVGAKLVVAKPGGHADSAYLVELIKERNITTLHFVPSALQVFLAEPGLEKITSLKRTICSGEALPFELQERFFARLATVDLFNLYGPTEAAVDVTHWTCEPDSNINYVPIGKPIANTEILMLDPYLRPVPIGVPGELHIGGAGLARGYLGRPDLTKEKFINHPFSADPEARLYKTGDLARFLPDGNIEYMGRLDNQVKIRGFRIELGEIEAALGRHPAVRENSVIVKAAPQADQIGDKRVVAYLVANEGDEGQEIDTAELRVFLKDSLPDYMVPAFFVMLEALPLTPNAKVDRKALEQMPLEGYKASEESFVAPRNSEEERLAAIWMEVLGAERVGVHDNFFEMGGHSLLVTQVIARIRDTFKIELPLKEIFEAPTVAALCEVLATRDSSAGSTGTMTAISTLNREESLPLSFAQHRLWFLEQLEGGGSATYNMPAALRIDGPLDRNILEKTFQELVQRHESLRTTFPMVDGVPEVRIDQQDFTDFKLNVMDFSKYSAKKREQDVRKAASADALKPFELAEGPLFRATLLLLGSDSYVLLLNMHHIVSDGWSMDVLIEEWSALYAAFSQGKASPLAPLPVQYVDFAGWQREWLKGEVLENQLDYWKQQLSDAPALLELPTDRPRPPVQTYKGDIIPFTLSGELQAQLKSLSQDANATLFMTLLASYGSLLSRYSGQSDVVIGSPIAGRTHSQLEPLIGNFVNALSLRLDLEGNPLFGELLEQTRRTALDAFAHQDIPFERLVTELQPERNMAHSPLFQAVFVLHTQTKSDLEIEGLKLTHLEREGAIAKFDLTLSMEETEDGMNCAFEYNTDLFDRPTIERMIGHFKTMLESLTADKHIRELPLLTEGEAEQLISWNKSPAEYAQDKTLMDLFEEQVVKTPAAVAVVFEDQQLTYQELNGKANQLARYLQGLGVGPEVLVGICLERSAQMMVGLLAILKAGGAYLPLDPNYPASRLSFLLEDSNVPVLLTQESVKATLSEMTETAEMAETTAKMVFLDKDAESFSHLDTANLSSGAKPSSLAYVIYTSGSTGKPKGVEVTHFNVTRLFAATDAWFHFDGNDAWTFFHSYAFDFSVWEIWGALLHGGRLVVVPYMVSRSPEAFYELLCKEKVTVLNQTPSAFRQLIQAEEKLGVNADLNLRFVIFGGEALDFRSLKSWYERHSDTEPQLVNMYGITETTVHVTYHPLTEAEVNNPSSVIGVPIPDLQAWTLDPYLQPVPIGVPGELHIGGAGLARGYLGRPELTRERFIQSPLGNDTDARLYKTGDLARRLADGNLEYLGRIDNQVKIRGFRIELGEIEAALEKHSTVRDAVVRVLEDSNGHKSLVGYAVPHSSDDFSALTLREFLKENIPDYMVPASITELAELPLTAHGKINYRALPAPETAGREALATLVLPETPDEQLLADIWSDVLGIKQVGITDNYFDLGGDSIRSIQVLTRAKEAGMLFTLQQLFQHPTIKELGRLARNEAQDPLASVGPTEAFDLISEEDRAKLPEGIADAYPLATLQAGMIFHSQYSPETAVYHDVFSYYFKAQLDLENFQKAIQAVVQAHPVLRTGFSLNEFSEPLQLVHEEIEMPLDVEDLSHLGEQEQETALAEWIEAEKNHQFDWNRPSLLRMQIHRRSEETFNLTLSFHHAILDGWSLASMLTELFQRYFALLGQGEFQAPEAPTVAFRDFVGLERLMIESEEYRNFWFEKNKGYTFLKLPRWPESHRKSEAGQASALHVTLPDAVSSAVKQLAKEARVPVKSVLLAAHLRVMSVLGNQKDVLTGLVSNSRLDEEGGERILGLFLNTLPFRLELSGGSWMELVQETFKSERDALLYRRFPLAEVQRMQGGENLFETAFNFTHFHVYQDIISAEGLEVLGGQFFEETNFALSAYFSLDLVTEEVNLTLHYDINELCEEQVKSIGDYYAEALSAMGNSQELYENSSLLSKSEKDNLLLEWNETTAEYPREQTTVELFEEQVERTPDAVAVVFEDESLTYRELNAKANQLSRHLRKLGVGPEVLVGICLERSLEMVIGLFGILKAGGAYLPLDPAVPAGRLEFMLDDANVAVLLSQSSLKDTLPKTSAHTLFLDEEAEALSRLSWENLGGLTKPENLAYVIYTSGSTGKPKGVQICHKALLNFLISMGEEPGLTGDDVLLAVTTLSFDIAGLEVYLPLIKGARMVLASRAEASDGTRLLQKIESEGITVMQATPATWHMLIGVGWEKSANLKILCGGEALTGELATLLVKKGGSVWNVYGPTETTIWSTLTEVTAESCDVGIVSIGHPMANTQVYILDSHLQPVPLGAAGELHIGGDGLARGYLGRPELTAEKFIQNPFSDDPNSRIYKTGDLARYLPDGNIEYLSRVDHQVKIRGYRIELGEIEAQLGQFPSVRESAVIVHELSQEDKRLAAYFVPQEGQSVDRLELRAFLKESLPDYMVPSYFITLDALPLTPNGKLDRRSLPEPEGTSFSGATQVMPQTEAEQRIAEIWKEVLKIDQVGVHDNFFETGGHSLLMWQVQKKLSEVFGEAPAIVELFQYPTIQSLAKHLTGEDSALILAERSKSAVPDSQDFAIIGMSGRFPGAKDVDAFWENLRDGVESIKQFTDEELLSFGVEQELLDNPKYVKASSVLEDIDLFDAEFFGYSPREAEIIDPQQRLLLECVWGALENAGYDVDRIKGATGLYAGSGMSTYLLHNLSSNPAVLESVGRFQLMVSNGNDHLSPRASYKMNLRGPSVNVRTACSTSLVAVHLACRSLALGECDMALAGGVSINVMQNEGYVHQEGMIMSPDGHCRAFDAKAAGTVGGSGAGIVVIKTLEQALADGDNIQAVIKGSAINNDGDSKVGYTAPSIEGQAGVIAEAMRDIDPETIQYIETHGTATTLGDPIEMAALTKAYRSRTARKGYCAIGSVKTNIGHLDTAAGVTGLIKTVLALKNKALPPSLHYETPNPQIDFENSPFFVNAELAEWEAGETPRRAGVSSFGIGGTNVHVVLEEAPEVKPAETEEVERPWHLLTLSAKSKPALEEATANLAEYFKKNPDLNLADAAHTLAVGRKAFEHRRGLVVRNTDEAIEALSAPKPGRVFTRAGTKEPRPLAFMFSGQGTQHVEMGLWLYRDESVFRELLDQCAEILKPHLKLNLIDVLYPDNEQMDWAKEQLARTAIAQPALFVYEYAMARLWMSWGMEPAAMIGHSFGEYAAACLAGVFSLEEALELMAIRGELVQALEGGVMLHVSLPEEEVTEFLTDDICLAAHNTPSMCILSGPVDAISKLEKELETRDVENMRLKSSYAFHSSMLDPILDSFRTQLKKMTFNVPRIPYISNLSGTWITPAEAMDPDYWVAQLRGTVRFTEGLQELVKHAKYAFMEVGPGQALATLAGEHLVRGEKPPFYLVRLPGEYQDDVGFLLGVLGKLWTAGVNVDWNKFHGGERRRLALPTYPFERKRYWIEPSEHTFDTSQALMKRKPDAADWLYLPLWKQSAPPAQAETSTAKEPKTWLLFEDEEGLGRGLAEKLKQADHDVLMVKAGTEFGKLDENEYSLNPRNPQDYEALLEELNSLNRLPQSIVHLWNVAQDSSESGATDVNDILTQADAAQYAGFFSLTFLAQALGKRDVSDEIKISVISNNLQEVDEEGLIPAKATLLGPVGVIGLEYPNLQVRSIDVRIPSTEAAKEKLIGTLLPELSAESTDQVVAYRGRHRWVQTYEAVPQDKKPVETSWFKAAGVYLITGGLGGIGLTLAEEATYQEGVKLVLIGRSAFPVVEEWSDWLTTHDEADAISLKIKKIQELEKLGAEVLVAQADVGDLQEMQAAVKMAEQRFGSINGVIHTAGISGEGLIMQNTPENAERILRPKVRGTLVLDSLLDHAALDFFIMFSSISTSLNTIGFSDYSGANAFLDAYAHHLYAKGIRAVSMNWDRWREVGMAAAPDIKEGMSSEEGIEAFQRIMNVAAPRVAVATRDFGVWIEQNNIAIQEKIKESLGHSDQAEPAHARPELSSEYVGPRDELELMLADTWQKLLGIEQIGIQDNFFELGGHSLLAVSLMAKIGQRLDKQLPVSALLQGTTIEKLAHLLRDESDVQSWSPLVPIQTNGSKRPIFCVPGAGGTVVYFYELSRQLGNDQPFYGLQAMGLDGISEPDTRVEDVAARNIKEIRSVQPEGPYLLAGHSFGGSVILEMARQLLEQGQETELLTVLDIPAPLPVNNPTVVDWDDARWLVELAGVMEQFTGKALEVTYDILSPMTPEEQLNYLKERLIYVNWLPAEADINQLRGLVNVFKANNTMDYALAGDLKVPRIVLLKADVQTEFPEDDKFTEALKDPKWGWGRFSDDTTVHIVPGDHITMLTLPHVERLAEILKILLGELPAVEDETRLVTSASGKSQDSGDILK